MEEEELLTKKSIIEGVRRAVLRLLTHFYPFTCSSWVREPPRNQDVWTCNVVYALRSFLIISNIEFLSIFINY